MEKEVPQTEILIAQVFPHMEFEFVHKESEYVIYRRQWIKGDGRFQKFLESEELLHELIILGKEKLDSNDIIIAHGKYIWIIDDENFEELEDDIIEKLDLDYEASGELYDLLYILMLSLVQHPMEHLNYNTKSGGIKPTQTISKKLLNNQVSLTLQ